MSDLLSSKLDSLLNASPAQTPGAAPPGKWLGMDGTYKDLNSTLNGLPDVVRNTPVPSDIQPGSATEKLAALNKGLYGSLPFGIGDWILKKTQPAQYAAMQEAAKNQPGWNTGGAIAGGLSQGFVAPALGAGGLAGAATKTAGNIIGRNVLNAAVASAPNAITQAAGGDIGGAAKNFALSTGAGAVLGSASEAIANKIPTILQGLKEWGQRRGVGAAGITTRDLRKALTNGPLGKYAGTTINNADDEVNALWTTLKSTGAFGKKSQEKLFGEQGEVWQQLAGGFNDNHVKLTDPTYKAGILSDPNIQALMGRADIGTPEEIQGMADKVIAGIDSGANYNAKKKIADELINQGYSKTVSGDVRAKATIAQIVKQNIDDIAGTFTPQLDVAGMKYDYHTLKPLFGALQRELTKIPAAEAGSPTAARLLTKNILMGGGEGGTGALLIGSGQQDDNRWSKILKYGIGGVLLGGAANKFIPRMFNKLGGQAMGRLSDLITPGSIAAMSNVAGTVAPQVATMVGKVPPQAIGDAIGGANMPVTGGTPMSDVTYGAPEQPVMPPGAQPIPNAPQGSAPTQQAMAPAPQGAATQATPAPQGPPPPSPVEQAQTQFTQNTNQQPAKIGKWDAATIDNRIQTMYSRFVRQYGQAISPNQFKQDVLQSTDNLNPMNPGTWKGMYDDAATAEKMYKDYMSLQKLPLDEPAFIPNALNFYSPHLFAPSAKSLDVNKQNEAAAHTTLVQSLADITKRTTKEVEERLMEISRNRGMSPEKKKEAVVDMIVQQGGIDWNTFHKMGLL
jgi:hypothetical protein